MQLEPWNGPPSNCEIGGTRGKPDGFLYAAGAAPRTLSAAAARSTGARLGRASGEPDGWTSNATGTGEPPGVSGAPAST